MKDEPGIICEQSVRELIVRLADVTAFLKAAQRDRAEIDRLLEVLETIGDIGAGYDGEGKSLEGLRSLVMEMSQLARSSIVGYKLMAGTPPRSSKRGLPSKK